MKRVIVFLRHTDRGLIQTDMDYMKNCWNWTGSILKNGYGSARDPESKKNMLAHRLSYTTFKGEIPKGLVIDHRCCNRKCVNPYHLEVVTDMENQQRRKERNWHKFYIKRAEKYNKLLLESIDNVNRVLEKVSLKAH